MVVLLLVLAVPVGLLLVVWAGSGMLRGGTGVSSSSNALGGFDAFNPGQGRMEMELESKKQQVVVTPSPGDDNNPVRVNWAKGSVTVHKPGPSSSSPTTPPSPSSPSSPSSPPSPPSPLSD